jgi:hypothetical protein
MLRFITLRRLICDDIAPAAIRTRVDDLHIQSCARGVAAVRRHAARERLARPAAPSRARDRGGRRP